jgi:hypothetical protein
MPIVRKKSLKSFDTFDRIFLLLILAALAAASLLLYRDMAGNAGRAGLSQVGTVTYKNRIAERRIQGGVLWDGLAQQGAIYNEDTVRTAGGASAIIRLDDASEISLGELTMVRVTVGPTGARIKVESGQVTVRRPALKSGAAAKALPLVIASGTDELSIRDGSVTLRASARQSAFQLDSGSASVVRAGQAVPVAPGQAIAAEDAAPATIPWIPESPAPGQVFFTDRGSTAVEFRVRDREDSSEVLDGYLTVAADSAFARIEFQGPLLRPATPVSLTEGVHYWKIGAGGSDTLPRWFSIIRQETPVLLGPSDQALFSYPDELPLVRFSWQKLEFATGYRLEVTADGGAPALVRTVNQTSLGIISLAQGSYRWRVVALVGPLGQEFASPFRGLRIRKAPLVPPQPASGPGRPGEMQPMLISTTAINNGSIVAAWAPVEGARGYQTVISRDQSGAEVVATVESSSNFLRLENPLAPGNYWVRVSALSLTTRSSASDPLALQVVDPLPLRLVAPIQGDTLDPGVRSIAFYWSDPNDGRRYRLQLSHDQGFGHPFTNLTIDGTQAVVSLVREHEGTIYWKAELLDAKNQVVVSSPVERFFLPRLYDDPRPQYPVNGEKVDVVVNDAITFNWQPVPQAKTYRVTLYQVIAGFKLPIQTWSTDKPGLVLDSFANLSTLPYAWELSARNDRGEIPGQTRSVTSYFSIIQSRALQAPSLISGRDRRTK